MGILSNFIGGAAQAGGEILQRERESGVRKDEAQFASDLAERRERALAELRNQYQIDSEGRQVTRTRDEEAYQASPERIEQLTAADLAKNRGIIKNRAELAPEAGKAAEAEFAAGAPVRKAEAAEKLVLWKTEYGAKTAAELQAEIDKLNNPDYLKGKAKEAAAGRDPNSAALARVQLAAASLALKEKEAEAKIPAAVKLRVEPIRDQMKTIAGAIAKAQGENMFDPESDNAKSLFKQYADAQKQLDALLSPYYGDKMPKAGEAPAGGLDKDLAARIAEIAAAKGGKADAPANKKPAAPAPYRDRMDIQAQQPIPDPPPKTFPNGKPNPSYAAWARQHKEAYDKKADPKKVTLPLRYSNP